MPTNCSFRADSRGTFAAPESRSLETLRTGALLRIADAVEKSTEYSDNMRRRMESAEAQVVAQRAENSRQRKVIAGLRGVITRNKNRAERLRTRAPDTRE
jgi:hypothetical protein